MRLEGKVALITGGARGIGAAIARRFVQEGAHVILNDVDPVGVEKTAAELHDFAYTARHYYPNVRPEEVKVILVHSGSRIMPEISEKLADYASKKLAENGVEVLLNTRVRCATADWVELTNEERIPTKTLIWTAGVAPSPLLATLPCARNAQGQIVVNEYLEVSGHPGVWAIGDCAQIPNPQTGVSFPPTAQHAVREGKTVAQNIAASIRGGRKKPFAYKPLGVLASLGRRSAVAEICGVYWSQSPCTSCIGKF